VLEYPAFALALRESNRLTEEQNEQARDEDDGIVSARSVFDRFAQSSGEMKQDQVKKDDAKKAKKATKTKKEQAKKDSMKGDS
jgi:hypothetical protein